MNDSTKTVPNFEPDNTQEIELELTEIPFLSLSEHYPKINAFSSFIGWAIILAALILFDFIVAKVNIPLFVFLIISSLSIVSALFGYYSAKACGYFQDKFDIYFKQGLWWRKQTALNFSRIQHIDISHGPIERRYQMATIKFFTAGGATSDLKISGLPNKIAESLRSDILKYAKENYQTDVNEEPKSIDEPDVSNNND